MKSNKKNVEIAKYWIVKAKDSLKSAQLEYEQKLLSFAANRPYYAAFYAASSVLAGRGQSYENIAPSVPLYIVILSRLVCFL